MSESDAIENVVYHRGEDVGSDAWDDTVLIKAYDNAVQAMKAKFEEQHPEVIAAQGTTKLNKKKKNKPKPRSRKKKNNQAKFHSHWNAGDICKAVYTEDGEIYTAHILAIDEDQGTCTVQYTEYGNEEEQPLDDLLPASSDASSLENLDTASERDTLKRKAREKPHPKKQAIGSDGQRSSQRSRSTKNPPQWPWNTPNLPNGGATPFPPTFPPFVPMPHHSAHPGFGMPSMFPHIPPPPPPLPPPPPFPNSNNENDSEALYAMLMSWYMSGYHTGYYQGMKNSPKGPSAYSPFR